MNKKISQPPDTRAEITLGDVDVSGPRAFLNSLLSAERIVDTVAFSYSHDILQLGDPFSVTIPNPKGKYTGKFGRGMGIRLELTNAAVNGGRPTLKHTGLIVRRTNLCSAQGTVIHLECADLGWHLTNNDAPLWFRLQHVPLRQLLTDGKFIHPSWGIKTPVLGADADKLTRRGVNNGRAQASIDAQNPLGTLCYIQVEPGDKVADLLTNYTRRINYLINVGADGSLILFRPDYNQAALYTINFHGFDEDNKSLDNILDVRIEEDITSIYTIVTCIGEIVGGDLTSDPANQNASKRIGSFVYDPEVLRKKGLPPGVGALPFRHNLNFADGEIYDGTSAKKQAQWKYERGVFDAWKAIYTVRGHHQNGNWYESDQMYTVRDSVNGLDGDFYCSSVTCVRDEHGDRTEITLRWPGLLQAAFGVMPRAPRVKVPAPPPNAGTTTETATTTTVTPQSTPDFPLQSRS